MTLEDNKIKFHEDKAMDFLKHASQTFETILDLEDRADGEKIEATLKAFEEEVDLTRWLVKMLHSPQK